jgi:hypothetical protein
VLSLEIDLFSLTFSPQIGEAGRRMAIAKMQNRFVIIITNNEIMVLVLSVSLCGVEAFPGLSYYQDRA